MNYYLGVDGGGTRTTALVCDETLRELVTVSGGSVNYCSEGMERARDNLRAILSEIAEKTGVGRFASAFIGSSALFGRADEATLRAFTDGVVVADRIAMDSDLYVALKSCETDNALAAVCGTGSMAAAFGPAGEVLTRGGFGYLFGDEGSAYAIAREAMFHAARSAEGTEPPTLLTGALSAFYGVKDVYAFTDLAYDPPMERKRLAAFAPEVTRCARQGDGTADAVLKRQAELFAGTVRSLASVTPQKPAVFCYGGVFAHDERFTAYFREALGDACVSCGPLAKPPVYGAVLAAREL
ncbi:MAG: hypothetical protein IJK89_02180 [Clostridia bacterium]|nr:hypothetical protein [Clostridia bacterium]